MKEPSLTYRRLLAKGAEKALAPDDEHGVKGIYYVKDPDGYWIELF